MEDAKCLSCDTDKVDGKCASCTPDETSEDAGETTEA